MNPTFVQQMAQQRVDAFYREAAANRHAALVSKTAARPAALRSHVNGIAGRLRLFLRGAVA